MVATARNTPQPTDYMAAVRALNRMRRAGFTLRLAGDSLQIAPIDRLNEQQRAYIREHKPALVQLLTDAETVYEALQAAGAAGIGWHEGTPPEWTDARLLAAGEVLYSDGRMVNRLDRRYCTESAPPALVEQPDIPSQQPPATATSEALHGRDYRRKDAP